MAMIDRIRAVQQRSPASFTPFVVADQIFGFVNQRVTGHLLGNFPEYFSLIKGSLVLLPGSSSFDERSEALAAVTLYFIEQDLIPKPRNELYPIKNHWNQVPVAELERNSSIPLGLVTYGVNLHAWITNQDDKQLLWVGKRSLDKQTEPGKLDHIAAGGQPATLGLYENMVKEAEEEASLPPYLAKKCRPVGPVIGNYHEEHCRRFIHYNFDLEVPPEFQPKPLDGEVESFSLMPPEQVIELLRDGYHFDIESAIGVIDWLVRHGHIHAENEPDFDEVFQGLRADLFTL